MRLELRHQREIARLHFQQASQSHRAIAKSVGVSPGAVKSVRDCLLKTQVTWNQIQGLDDKAWQAALKNENQTIAQRKLAPDWSYIHQEMHRPGATQQELWREFKEDCPEGVGYTQFCAGYSEWRLKLNVSMRRIHLPGEKLFVDFAGDTVTITNREDGTTWEAQIFLGVLGHSNYTYVEAVKTQKIPDWVMCHVHCFEAMGGAPTWVTSDRLKSAVIGSDRNAIYITPTYRECLKHYNSAPLPAGARKPKWKAKVEGGVLIAERWILFRLRNYTFFSLEELNAEIKKLCKELNTRPFKKLPGCRQSRFEEGERTALKPLPSAAYEYADWRYKVLVNSDYHFEHERCSYSVPYNLQRERVDLRITRSKIEVLHGGRRVAFHDRLLTPGEFHTMDEHRPIVHTRVLQGEPKALADWASTVGPHTNEMIQFHLTSRSDPTNGLRAAQRMRRLAEQHGEERFEEVCRYALPLNIRALRSVRSILEKNADKRHRPKTPTDAPAAHANIRGANYFGEEE